MSASPHTSELTPEEIDQRNLEVSSRPRREIEEELREILVRAIDITDWAKANGPSEFCDAAVWIEIVVGSAIGVLNGYPASYDGKIRPLDQHGNPVVPGDDKV